MENGVPAAPCLSSLTPVSNLAALVDHARAGHIEGAVTQVVSNRPDAAGLALARTVDEGEPDLVVLAGFMRVLGAGFVRTYAGRMINIHPSLLPLYPGLHTHRRALADGVRLHGCTVHYVTPDVDVGPIIAQGAVPVRDGDDEASLAARVLAVEHRLLPAAVGWHCEGRLTVADGRVRVAGAVAPADAALIAPPLSPERLSSS